MELSSPRNVVSSAYLTDGEIQSGIWLSSEQLDPGVYYVLMSASLSTTTCVDYPPSSDGRVVDALNRSGDGGTCAHSYPITRPVVRLGVGAGLPQRRIGFVPLSGERSRIVHVRLPRKDLRMRTRQSSARHRPRASASELL